MPRISLDGFKDSARRPRYIIWTGASVLLLAAVVIVALGVTSTYWFCAEGCHKVQDDTILAYNNSSHNKVSCMACHMPVNADPVTFLLHKAEALGELYLTVTNNFELPLNPTSHLAMVMPENQCTQCHNLTNRVPTPSVGIIIDHEIHHDSEVTCTMCHNRVAHPEDFELTLTDPKTGEPNRKHDDFMSMTACFRCHGHEDGAEAPGACAACHPADFNLKPANHEGEGFYPAGHAEMALAEVERIASIGAGGHGGESPEPSEDATQSSRRRLGIESAYASAASSDNPWVDALPAVGTINYCSTCHSEQFCSDCHGLPMPHPANFQEGHGELGNSQPATCATCHSVSGAADDTQFCNACHHPEGDPTLPWIPQHFDAVRETGAQACFKCHKPTYCAECHVAGALGR
ncbi:MAG: NapC/NirT family cytochrome c [Coriobacteriia bacterium]|nr:NapC/NirT family cytochrome c [Coriobacteriia bacterium]